MADEETEDVEKSLAEKSFLFPIVAANNEDKRDAKEIKPLFPSVSVGRSEEKGKKISDIDNLIVSILLDIACHISASDMVHFILISNIHYQYT